MSPQDLLKETEKAAGDARLTEWHETLIKAGKELTQLSKVLIIAPRSLILATHHAF